MSYSHKIVGYKCVIHSSKRKLNKLKEKKNELLLRTKTRCMLYILVNSQANSTKTLIHIDEQFRKFSNSNVQTQSKPLDLQNPFLSFQF